ncbi:hypothetical protein V1477_000883 [Vespula maculifrons]|uniref:Uncharacterized protein n=1 Tax=Vespula maculifrons TaxID=7453 RepID=A0ABD2D077_VESMC
MNYETGVTGKSAIPSEPLIRAKTLPRPHNFADLDTEQNEDKGRTYSQKRYTMASRQRRTRRSHRCKVSTTLAEFFLGCWCRRKDAFESQDISPEKDATRRIPQDVLGQAGASNLDVPIADTTARCRPMGSRDLSRIGVVEVLVVTVIQVEEKEEEEEEEEEEKEEEEKVIIVVVIVVVVVEVVIVIVAVVQVEKEIEIVVVIEEEEEEKEEEEEEEEEGGRRQLNF